MKGTALISLLLLACLPGHGLGAMEFQHARDRAQLDREQTPRLTFATPHVNWGSPLPAGPVRALFIIHVTDPGTNAREIVEVMQRFDVQAAVVFEKDGMLYGEQEGRRRLRDLLRARYDVFVLGQVSMDLLGYEQQYQLLKQVVAGTGLICIGPRPETILTPARRVGPAGAALGPGSGLAGLVPGGSSEQLAGRVATSYRLKQGRALHLDFQPLLPMGRSCLTPELPFSWGNLARYEYWSAFVGRAILWAAGRELPVRITGTPLEGRTLAAGREQAVPALAWAGPTPGCWEAHVRRLDDGRRLAARAWAQGRQVWVRVPALQAGEYMLELRGREQSRPTAPVLGFAAVPFAAESDCQVQALRLSRGWLEVGEALQVAATIAGRMQTGDVLRLRARDSYRREIWRRDLPLIRQPPPVSFQADGQCSIWMQMEAAWLRGGVELSCAVQPFRVTRRNREHFAMVMWDAPTDVLGYWAVQRMSQAGFNVNLRGGPPVDTTAAWGWAQIPYTTRLLDEYDKEGRMQPCSWNDEPAIQAQVQKVAAAYRESREHGVYAYSLGDETTTLGASTDPTDLAAYRQWLREQYGEVGALNASWGSSYRSFDEVDLIGYGKFTGRELALEQAALDAGLTARWFDRQAFARHNYLRLCARYGEAFRRLDAQERTGFEGAGGFFDDVDAIVASNPFWSPYPGPADEILRSVTPPWYPRSNWVGYCRTVPPISSDTMRLVSNGSSAFFWWRWDNIGQYIGYLEPDLDFGKTTGTLNQELAPVRWGLGDWLLDATRQHDGIAIYHSLSSALAPQAIRGMFAEQSELAHRGLQAALEDLGVQYQYVTERQVLQGRLGDGNFKLLFLPQTHALCREAALQIKVFAAAGGYVVADAPPGRFDGHLAPQLPPLAGLFEDSGQGVLLKGDLMNYQRPRSPVYDRDLPVGAALRAELAGVLARARVSCPVRVEAVSGNLPPRVELVRWRQGEAEVVGVFYYPVDGYDGGRFSPTVRLRLVLAGERFVHVIGDAAPPRAASQVLLKLPAGQAVFVACSSRPLQPVAAAVPAQVRMGADFKVRITARDGLPHPVRLELLAPDGSRALWVEGAWVVKGADSRTLRAAWNEMPGRWRVRVTDWFTGARLELPVRLSA